MKPRVLITGAGGVIAGRIIPELEKRYDLVLLDRRDLAIPNAVTADLLDRNRDAYRGHFRGVHAVVHSAFARADDPEETFWAELDNVTMAYNLYRTALEEGVRRVVVMSSNHAADFYEPFLLSGDLLSIGPNTPPLSDNLYGWAKIAYEALGFVFAAGKVGGGRRLSNVQLRIGAPRETDIDSCAPGDLRKLKRDLGAYLSLRDEVELVEKSIEIENIDDEYGIPFQIFYGVSGNTFGFWSIENARRVIGYDPKDDSASRFAAKVAEVLGNGNAPRARS